MTHVFKHPKFYRIPRDKSDQAISGASSTEQVERASGPGHKQQASSYKLPGPRPISNANKGLIHKQQAPSFKRQASQAASHKPQAPSSKRQA